MRRMLTLTAVAAAALVLAGCSILPFGDGGPATGGSDGSGGSAGTGQSGQTGPAPGDEGEGDDGTVVLGPGRLPASWPSDVYVPDGEILNAVEGPGTWVAEVAVADVATAAAEVSAALQAAGFTIVAETGSGSGWIGVYEDDRYQVNVLGSDSGTPKLTYSIVEK